MSHNTFGEGLGYEGKVTLTLKSNNRVLKSQTYKNNGTANLFKFLGYCLIGQSNDVKNLLPNKVALLFNKSSTPASATFTNVDYSSGLYEWAQTPSIISTAAPAEVKVTYSFEIAKNAITRNFNQVALYGNGCTDPIANISDCAAYYYLTDSSKNEFEEENINLWSDTTVLLIDWELRLSNAEVENT